MYKAIIKLWISGKSKRSISRSLGHDIKTVRKIIKKYESDGVDSASYVPQKSQCEPHKEKIEEYLSTGLAVILHIYSQVVVDLGSLYLTLL